MALLMQAAERVAEARNALRGMGKETASIVEKGTKNIVDTKRKVSCSVAQIGGSGTRHMIDEETPKAAAMAWLVRAGGEEVGPLRASRQSSPKVKGTSNRRSAASPRGAAAVSSSTVDDALRRSLVGV